MKRLQHLILSTGIVACFATFSQAATLASYEFPAVSSLVATTVSPNLTASDMALSSGTIDTNILTGTYFPSEPYIEESGGWTAATQATAKNFFVTITADAGYEFSIENVAFRAYSTSAGPTGVGFAVGSTNLFASNAPDSSVVAINETVVGQTGLTSATVRIQGFLNGSRSSTGGGDFRIDDLIISGTVVAVPEPTAVFFGSIGLLAILRRRR